MNAKILLLFAAIFVVLVVSIANAHALTITGNGSVNLCQCETSKQAYTVCTDIPGTYSVVAEGLGAKWVSIAPAELSFTSSECKTFYSFITPECYASASTYPIEYAVYGPENSRATFSIGVSQCHTFDYSITQTSSTSDPCVDNNYSIFVKNTGQFCDEFVLLQEGLNDAWVGYPKEKIKLNPGQEFSGELTVKSYCSTPAGTYPFDMSLSNTMTNSEQTISLVQGINGFEPLSNNFPPLVESCSEADKNFTFFIKNNSNKSDTINLSLEAPAFVSVDINTFTFAAGESKDFIVKVKSTTPQEVSATLVISSANYEKIYRIPFTIRANKCYNMTASDLPSVIDVNCDTSTLVELNISNRGAETEAVRLLKESPEWVTLSEETFTIVPDSNQQAYIYMHPDCAALDSNMNLKVEDTKGLVRDYNVLINIVEPCGLSCDLNVPGMMNFTLDYNFTNDTNDMLRVLDMNVFGIESKSDFNKPIDLAPGQSVLAKLTLSVAEGLAGQDLNITVDIYTDKAKFTNEHTIKVPTKEGGITALFSEYAAPAVGLGLLLIILVAIIIVASMAVKPKEPVPVDAKTAEAKTEKAKKKKK